jgi:hypothetical protein
MNTALVPVGSTLIVPGKRLYIAGFDGLDESDQAIPYVRVVQPTSTECKGWIDRMREAASSTTPP